LSFALFGGCVADAGLSYQAQVVAPAPTVEVEATAVAPDPAADVQVEATVEEPELVEVDSAPGVQVVYDTDVPVFYSDNFYWRFDGGIWYRSTVHTGGWAVYNDPPERIRHIDRPTQYSHYRPATYTPRAQRPGYVPPRRVGTTTTTRPGYTRPATSPTYGGRPATTTHSPTTPAYGGRPATTTTVHSPTNTYQPAGTRPAGTMTHGTAPATTGYGARPTTPTTARPAPAAKPPTPTTAKTPPKKYERDKK
jgi:hypothetical protein